MFRVCSVHNINHVQIECMSFLILQISKTTKLSDITKISNVAKIGSIGRTSSVVKIACIADLRTLP